MVACTQEANTNICYRLYRLYIGYTVFDLDIDFAALWFSAGIATKTWYCLSHGCILFQQCWVPHLHLTRPGWEGSAAVLTTQTASPCQICCVLWQACISPL